tara:strand:- start:174 stop:533 length:360 start_codon:yes stop_codon:yes gene_type:complete
MEKLLPILIGTSIGFGFYYENLKLQKQIKEVQIERDDIKKQIYRYFINTKRAVAEAKKNKHYRYQSEIWKADSEQLVDELLTRTDEIGQPLFLAHCVSDEFTKNRLVGLIVRKKIVLES